MTAIVAPAPTSRSTGRPLWPHAAGLFVVLVGVALLLGPVARFTSDESAPLLQAQMLADGEGWTVEHPLVGLDPEGTGFFLTYADGGPAAFAPYAKHPVYPLVLVPLTAVGGVLGAVLLSCGGAVLAALAAAGLARRIDAGFAVPALWITGLLSPLFFDAQLVAAHTLGAALCGWATWFLLARPRRGIGHTLVACLLVAAAVLLRTEAVLFGVALGGAFLVVAVRARRYRLVADGLAVMAVGIITHVLERRWLAEIAGPGAALATGGVASDGFWSSRVLAAVWTTVAPTGAGAGWTARIVVVVGVLVACAGIALRRRAPDITAATVLLGLAAIGALVGVFLPEPDAVSGLLAAFPLLLLGLVLFRREDLRSPEALLLAATVGGFTALVLATQYDVGGAAEWGGRFLALALPLFVVLLLIPLVRTAAVLGGAARPMGVALVVLSLGFSVLAVRALETTQRDNGSVVRALTATLDEIGGGPGAAAGEVRPVVLTTWPQMGRFAWRDVDRVRGLVVEPGDLPARLRQLTEEAEAGVILVSSDPARDAAALREVGSWQVSGRRDAARGMQVLVLEPA